MYNTQRTVDECRLKKVGDRTIKRILLGKDGVTGRGLNSIDIGIGIERNNLVERLELLILETKAGHAGLKNEMLNISKQLLSMNINKQEQLDNLCLIMVNK